MQVCVCVHGQLIRGNKSMREGRGCGGEGGREEGRVRVGEGG